ncbi:unnamed protein product [Clonostachys rosea]|uniref:Protein kinase domain-containing protein n=1 Tax=Bionectria ochroleuca TaxID=29856 RepID=A0ABY6U8L5_BIOOC|nr:unnamed protein product [Clonostachys rosea]
MDLVPFVQLSDLGSAFSNDSPPAKMVTPSYLRSPELILGLKLSEAVDIWSFGCFIFQILAGSSLFIVEALEGDSSDEETNDEHLIQISEVLCPLPENLFQHWRRGRGYFDADGTRLRIKEKEDPYTTDSDSEADQKHDTPIESVESSDESTDGTAPWADAPVFETLEQLLQRKCIYDMNDSELKDVASLMRWILQVNASQRPSVDEILNHPWFSA